MVVTIAVLIAIQPCRPRPGGIQSRVMQPIPALAMPASRKGIRSIHHLESSHLEPVNITENSSSTQ
jgi:hypothetical protein